MIVGAEIDRLLFRTETKLVKVRFSYNGLDVDEEFVLMVVPYEMTSEDLRAMIDGIKNEFEKNGYDDWGLNDILEELMKKGIEVLDVDEYYVSI